MATEVKNWERNFERYLKVPGMATNNGTLQIVWNLQLNWFFVLFCWVKQFFNVLVTGRKYYYLMLT